ncbi:MAG TPA: abortive infection family protein [Syntrophomonadaceae bacterium]|nr:abortive infection family protein [Syntrophomonadaceae bacterium]
MKPNPDRNKVVLALKRAVEATFDREKWMELGYLTDSIGIIEMHPRLLRSLHWGDQDYGACILEVLPKILGDNLENLRIVEEFVGLEDWLRRNNPQLCAELYGGTPVTFEEIEEIGKIRNVYELNQNVARIRRSLPDDPALAVGSAKELLESVMKTILAEEGVELSNEEIPELLKMCRKFLGLDPKTATAGPEGEILRRILNSLGQIVVGVAEVRNLVGTGHGRSRGPQIDVVHARLVVNAATTIATYFLELWEARGKL